MFVSVAMEMFSKLVCTTIVPTVRPSYSLPARSHGIVIRERSNIQRAWSIGMRNLGFDNGKVLKELGFQERAGGGSRKEAFTCWCQKVSGEESAETVVSEVEFPQDGVKSPAQILCLHYTNSAAVESV